MKKFDSVGTRVGSGSIDHQSRSQCSTPGSGMDRPAGTDSEMDVVESFALGWTF